MKILPRNMLLFACHATNEVVQLNQLRRWYQAQGLTVTERVRRSSYTCMLPNSYACRCNNATMRLELG